MNRLCLLVFVVSCNKEAISLESIENRATQLQEQLEEIRAEKNEEFEISSAVSAHYTVAIDKISNLLKDDELTSIMYDSEAIHHESAPNMVDILTNAEYCIYISDIVDSGMVLLGMDGALLTLDDIEDFPYFCVCPDMMSLYFEALKYPGIVFRTVWENEDNTCMSTRMLADTGGRTLIAINRLDGICHLGTTMDFTGEENKQ